MRRLLQEAPQGGAVPPVAAPPQAEPARPEPAPAPRPLAPALEGFAPEAAAPVRVAAPQPTLDGEQWVGQRGLLAVGVVAVVLAAGYLLKLSFDRGWISPAMRCIGGGIAGLAVGFVGWRVEQRGYRSYGPALIGTGAAIIYVSVWAASRLYGFLPPMAGIAGMALVALTLAAVARWMDAEPLGAAAAVGAFLAPVVIGHVEADANRLMVYLAAMGFGLGFVAWEKGWRLTALLVALSYFGLGLPVAEDAGAWMTLAFGAAGGAAGLALGLKRGWWETRFLAFWGGWGCLALIHVASLAPMILLAGVLLSAPVWRHALVQDGVWPFEGATSGDRAVLPSLYFYVTPFWLAWAVDHLKWETFQTHEGVPIAIVAVAYVATAIVAQRRAFAVVGTLGLLLATLVEWESGITAAGVAGILALAWGATGRVTGRREWNLHALTAIALGILVLWTGGVEERGLASAAFVDRWALLLWGSIAVTIALATDLSAPDGAQDSLRRPVLWGTAGLVLLVGVSGELHRFFRQRLDPEAASLAGGLAISVWWLLFAGAAVWYGFRSGLRPLRIAGLWVSGLAVLKVVFVDLSTLDALYRVASVFGLGLVSLLVAWAYHRRAKLVN
jgi:hypothetical protein